MKKVVVTGASGFIGARLVEVLACRGDTTICAVVRRGANPARIARYKNVHLHFGDVTSMESLKAAMQGCEQIFHCAYGNKGTEVERRKVTVQGTVNVVKVARTLGIPRVVYLSSTAVFGYDAEGNIDESSPYGRNLRDYCQHKKEAEQKILKFVRPGQPPSIAILLPTTVYGPYSPFVIDTVRRIKEGQFGLPPRFGIANHIYVDDLVHAMLIAAEAEITGAERFIVTDTNPEPYDKFFLRFVKMVGLSSLPVAECSPESAKLSDKPSLLKALRSVFADKEVRRAIITLPAMRAIYTTTKFLFPNLLRRLTESYTESISLFEPYASATKPVRLSPNEWKFYSSTVVFSCRKAIQTLGFSPVIGIDEGIRLTTLWLSDIGLVG